jgi:hypothetical protein
MSVMEVRGREKTVMAKATALETALAIRKDRQLSLYVR